MMLLVDFSENHFDFSLNFLKFLFNQVDLQIIINISRYESKGWTLEVLDNYQVTFLGGREDPSFCSSLYRVLVLYNVEKSEL